MWLFQKVILKSFSYILVAYILINYTQIIGCLQVDNQELLAAEYINELNQVAEKNLQLLTTAEWNYESDITDENLQETLKIKSQVANASKAYWQRTIQYDWKNFQNELLKRQFHFAATLDTDVLPDNKLVRYSELISRMQEIYSTTTVCSYSNRTKCDLSLDPDLTDILANSRNPNELLHVWREWHNAVGRACRPLYPEYVNLSNEAATLNNFTDTAASWLDEFEDAAIQQKFTDLWMQIQPFYVQLHAYVRHRLRQKYGGKIVRNTRSIPVHLLGNMWAQTWENIYDLTMPYPNLTSSGENLDTTLKNQNYTIEKIFRTAEEFFTSINLTNMTDTFWNKSITRKPIDRRVTCHASAWDFSRTDDFRIKMCTERTFNDFITVHHEMGHIQYYMQYQHQPSVFRGGANSGFHEAIGDLISLSVQSTRHLYTIGLSNNSKPNAQDVINNQYLVCLQKLPFLPFALSLEMWRWKVFQGKITPDNYNSKWWELRNEFQGVAPSIPRSDNEFDPGAKMHISASVPYIRYFVSFIIQFQFHQALCEKIGQYGPDQPLHNCDIYRSTVAGNALKEMLSLGRSKPWPEALETLTGTKSMDASSLLEYFKPIHEWLRQENERTGAHIGWKQ